MPRQVAKIQMPAESRLYAELGRASFHDAFESDLRDERLTAVEIALRFLRETPAWVEALLAIRNRAVALAGLRDVGRLGAVDERPAAAYAAGDRLSIFNVVSVSEGELVLAADDSHLDARIAFLKRRPDRRPRYAVCSLVTTHNALGRLYMLPVGRIHPLIVRQAMRNLEI